MAFPWSTPLEWIDDDVIMESREWKLSENATPYGAYNSFLVSSSNQNNPKMGHSAFQAAFATSLELQQQQQQQQQQHSIICLTELYSEVPTYAAAMAPAISKLTSLAPNCVITVNIHLTSGSTNETRVVTVRVPASIIQENFLFKILTTRMLSALINAPAHLASSVLQKHIVGMLLDPKYLQILRQQEIALPISMNMQSHPAIYSVTFNETTKAFNVFVNDNSERKHIHGAKSSKGKAAVQMDIDEPAIADYNDDDVEMLDISLQPYVDGAMHIHSVN